MPLSIADNLVHTNTGSVTTTGVGTPITVELAGADETQEDNFLLVFLAGSPPVLNFTFTTPSGWVNATNPDGLGFQIFYRGPAQGLVASESSWDFTPSATPGEECTWQVYELSGIDPNSPFEVPVTGTHLSTATGTVQTSSPTAKTISYDALWVTAFYFRDADNVTPATWGSHTNSFTEIGESGVGSGAHSVALSVAARPVQTLGSYGLSATLSRSFATNETGFLYFALTARNAPKQTDMAQLDGGESYQVGTATAGVTLDAAAARSGAVGYLLSSTTAACNKTLTAAAVSALGGWSAHRLHFQLPDTTDRAQIAYFTLTTSTGQTSVLTLRLTGGNLGLNWTSGATSGGEQLSDQDITADQWFGVDIRVDWRSRTNGGGALAVNWAVDYNAELTDTEPAVTQTPVTATNTATGASISAFNTRAGWSSALTSTMWFDDYGQTPGYNYPIGDLRVLPLKVDPAGTPTVTGSTSNFGVMTSNGTVAAWNATNARNAVDDIPPVTGGSRDAAVAVTAHASDTANFPMETVDLAANKVNVRGVKAHWWIWAASATTATIRIFVSDGTDVHTMYAEADPNADNTAMIYANGVVRASATTPPNWTQTKVDALEFRFGSNDATPDIGLDAMLLEMAVVKALPETLFGEAGEPIYVEAHRDPATYALVGATVNNNSGDPIELAWEVDGVPDTSGSIPDGTSGQYVPMSPDGTIEKVNRVSVIPG